MTRAKVLAIAAAIILLGAIQLVRSQGERTRVARIATGSGMIALLTGVGIGIYGFSLRQKK